MSQGQQSSSQQSETTKGEPSDTGRETSSINSDEWSDIKDPSERRKIQNKLAQRRFRDKVKEQKEETEREAENQRRAGSSYASPEPENIDNNPTLSGLPWGGISLKHIVETGKNKEQSSQQSSRESRENSVYGSASQTGGRLGLRLTDRFARGDPAWKYFRYFPYHYAGRAQR
ncbi:Nn.00g099540.m01.CDS01 [Neocucurbitaria sp. VM-36]